MNTDIFYALEEIDVRVNTVTLNFAAPFVYFNKPTTSKTINKTSTPSANDFSRNGHPASSLSFKFTCSGTA